MMTSLKNDYGAQRCSSEGTKTRRGDANLREDRLVVQSDSQRLDTNFRAALSAFPYIGKASKGNRFVIDSGEVARCGV